MMDPAPDYSSKRFLIVDDEAFMLGQLERILKLCKPGFIAKATDGGTALRAIEDASTPFDCIITDFAMKPLNGLQLLSAIRVGANPMTRRDQRLILLTGSVDIQVMTVANGLDVNAIVAKPVTPKNLYPALHRVLDTLLPIQPADVYRDINLPSESES